MKTILLIIPSSKGTISKVSYNIYSALKKEAETKVYVANLYDNGPCEYDREDMCIFAAKRFKNIRKLFFLRDLKKKLNIDISISTIVACNTLNVLSSRGENTIGIFHAPLEQYKSQGPFVYFLCRMSYQFLYGKLDRLFAVSKTTQESIQRFVKKKVDLVYNIHDFDSIQKKSCEPLNETEREVFSHPTILYTGRLNELKGATRALESFAIFLKNHPQSDARLVFVGGDQQGNNPVRYIEKAKSLGIDKQCVFLGWQNNPYKYMKACTAFVSPSHSEGLPGVLIESLFLGKKVISTNSSKGVWEILQCYDDYNPELRTIYETDLGYITPNLDNEERLNEELLCKAFEMVLDDTTLHGTFDIARFRSDNIINYYTLRK